MSQGYWIKALEVIDVTTGSHVRAIINDPEHFGMTKEMVSSAYHRHGEKLGIEGKAREELVMNAMANGFIRIRHYPKPVDCWAVQFNDFQGSKATVLSFLKTLLEKGAIHLLDDLLLRGFADGLDETIAVQDLLLREGPKQSQDLL